MNEFLLKMHDDLNNIWSKIDALQSLVYLSIPDNEKCDEISNRLFGLKEKIVEIRDEYPPEFED